MDKKKKKRILKELKKQAQKVKHIPDSGIKFTLKSGRTSSLAKVVKTKEQADLFMKMLRALGPS